MPDRLTDTCGPHCGVKDGFVGHHRCDECHAGCPDGGKCHHVCPPPGCFRVITAGPLSGVYPDNRWPENIRRAHDVTTTR